MMRTILSIAVAGLVIATAIDIAAAQSRRGTATQQQTQTRTPSGLPPCSERPFARDCDRRGTW
jgi:hypothetical protein